MIERVKGLIEKKGSSSVILGVNGIGLELNMSVNAIESLPPIGKEIQILTFLNVREDLLELYGFVNKLERQTFLLLISISGIGPKLALTILSGISTDNLKDSIIAGDVPSLTRIPGVGSKTAKRIIIELKEKFIDEDTTDTQYSLHGFRKGGTMQAIKDGMDITSTMKQADWKTAEMVIHYTKNTPIDMHANNVINIYL